MLPTRKTATALVAIACSASVAGGCSGSEPHPTASSKEKHATSSPDSPLLASAKLASIQVGHEVSADDPLIKSIERFTASLQRRCREDAIHIDGIAGSMSSDLRKHGISETPLAALRRLNRIVPPEARSFDCTGAAAGYLVLREPE